MTTADIKHAAIIATFKRAETNGHAKNSTCNYPNWDIKEHLEMNAIYHNGITGYSITKEINFGVSDWMIIKIY